MGRRSTTAHGGARVASQRSPSGPVFRGIRWTDGRVTVTRNGVPITELTPDDAFALVTVLADMLGFDVSRQGL